MTKKLGVRAFVISDFRSEADRKLLIEMSESVFFVPYSGFLSGLLTIIPIQLCAFETALAQGRNPDYPRSLTKVVL